jgi:hypothetical protein
MLAACNNMLNASKEEGIIDQYFPLEASPVFSTAHM